MPDKRSPAARGDRPAAPPTRRVDYDLMLLVERYESLAEDMEELGVATLDEVRQKIAELHSQLDAQEG